MTRSRQSLSVVLEVEKLTMSEESIPSPPSTPTDVLKASVPENPPDLEIRKADEKSSYQMMLTEFRRKFEEVREKMYEKFRMEFGPNILKFKELIGQEVNLTTEPEIDELIEEVQKMSAQYRRLSADAEAFRVASSTCNGKMRDLGGRFHTVSLFERDTPGVQSNCYQLSAILATMSTNGNNNHKDCLGEVLRGFADAFRNLANTVMDDALSATRSYYTRRYDLDAARYKLEIFNDSPSVSAYEREKLKEDIQAKTQPYILAKLALKSKMGLMKQYRTQLVYEQSKKLQEALIRYHEVNLAALKESLAKTESNYQQEEGMSSFERCSEHA